MPSTGDDLALQQPPIPMAPRGALVIVKCWEDSNAEVRNLLANECGIIFECRECRNLFRSLVNFISHKRVACRALLEAPGPSSSEVQQFLEKAITNIDSTATTSQATSQPVLAEPSEPLVKKKAYLRRTNIVSVISKRAEHYAKKLPDSKETFVLHKLPNVSRAVPTTTFKSGQQVFVTIPKNLAEKEPLPSDKVTLVMPQDHSIKYREMNLRRRENDPKVPPARPATYEERELADRLSAYPELVDAGTLTCLHSDCTEKQPFSSLYTIAYHVTARHNRRFFPLKFLCFLCGGHFDTYVNTMVHLKKEHGKYYEEHRSYRNAPNEDKTDSRKSRKRKGSEKEKGGSSEHSGSLSPVSDSSEEDDTILYRFDYDFRNSDALDATENGFEDKEQ